MKVIITFDLKDADSKDYTKAYKLLSSIGLEVVSLNKKVALPNTTVMGELVNIHVEVSELRDFIWNYFKENDLIPESIFGGVLEDWAVKTNKP